MPEVLTCLEILVRKTQRPESEIMAQAFETGVRQRWRDRALGKHLRGEIGRDEAIADVGIDWVEMAERQHRAMREDMAWAMQSS